MRSCTLDKKTFLHDLIQSFVTAVMLSFLIGILLLGIILISHYASAVTPDGIDKSGMLLIPSTHV